MVLSCLDVGCSTGRLGRELRTRKACFVIGIEMNEQSAAKARENIDYSTSSLSQVSELGILQLPDQGGFADLCPIFPNKEYIRSNMREGLAVDRIPDLHNIDFRLNFV